MALPSCNERNSVTCVPDVGLLALPVRISAMRKQFFVRDFPVRSVIAGEDQQGVVGKTGLLQCAHHGAEHIIHLSHEVTVDTRLRPAFVLGFWNPWSMGRAE